MATPIILPDPLDLSKATKEGWVQDFDYEDLETISLEEAYPDSPVFGSTESYEVAQGGIGDCGSIAEIAAYAETRSKYKIEEGIYPSTRSETGQYWVRFAQGTKLFWVKIDSKVPTRNGKKPCYCKPKSEPVGLWPSLLEKAKATVKGGAYSMLTNYPNTEYRKVYTKEFSGWFPITTEMVTDYNRAKEIIGQGGFANFAFPKQVDDDGEVVAIPGLVTGHAFTSSDADIAIDAEGEEHKLVHVENPWGAGKDYDNLYAQDSDFWDGVANRDRFLSQSVFGGSWWMSWEELLEVKNTNRIQYRVPLPSPDMPHLSEHEFEFNDSNRTPARSPGLKKLKECGEEPIRLKLDKAGKLNIKLSWMVKNKVRLYFILAKGDEEIMKSAKSSTVVKSVELEAGEYEMYPANYKQNELEGKIRIIIQGNVAFQPSA